MKTTAEDARGLVRSLALAGGWDVIASESLNAANPHLIVAKCEQPIWHIWVKGAGGKFTDAQKRKSNLILGAGGHTALITSDHAGLAAALHILGIATSTVDVGDET